MSSKAVSHSLSPGPKPGTWQEPHKWTEGVGASVPFEAEQHCLRWDTRLSPFFFFPVDIVEQDTLFPASLSLSGYLGHGKAAPLGTFPKDTFWPSQSPCPGSDSEGQTGPLLGSGPTQH